MSLRAKSGGKFGDVFENKLLHLVCSECTLTGQKYFNTTKYLCTDCAIYRLKNQLEPRWEFEICRDQKFIVLALTLVKIFDFLTFHEVLIY